MTISQRDWWTTFPPKDRFSDLVYPWTTASQPSMDSTVSALTNLSVQIALYSFWLPVNEELISVSSRVNFPSFTSKTLKPKEESLFFKRHWDTLLLTGTSILLLALVFLRSKIAFLIEKATDFLLSSFMDIVYSMYLIIYLIFLNFVLSNISSVLIHFFVVYW